MWGEVRGREVCVGVGEGRGGRVRGGLCKGR